MEQSRTMQVPEAVVTQILPPASGTCNNYSQVYSTVNRRGSVITVYKYSSLLSGLHDSNDVN